MDVLIAGARLGPYEVLAPLGAGGMGRVYRATDTRLGRTVAIKVLRPELSGDLASRGRFEREARSIAALSHPHICTLHDVGDHNGQAFLVMELLEGQTLAARLSAVNGGLPVAEALSIAAAVADAVAFAHRHRIVHRDIKPANIMLTPTGVKLVDFGLARWRERDDVNANGPTQSSLTKPHAVMGTLGYMSPEQLDGRADERSDVFAFGAVLFEMLTGRKTFTGDSSVKVMAAIVHEDPPPVSSLRPVPAALDRVVQRCLAKDADSRWQSMADLADEIRWIAREPASARPATAPRSVRLMTSTAVALATLVIAALIGVREYSRAPVEPLVRLSFNLPQGTVLPDSAGGVAVSPDGETVVYVGATASGFSSRRDLFLRRLDSPDVKVIADSEGATYPFFAPDGKSVGFVADGKLKKLSIESGAVSVIADLGRNSLLGSDASWGTDGSILISDTNDMSSLGIRRISAMNGSVEVLTRPDQARGELNHYGAQRLPGIDTFLYAARLVGTSGFEFRVVAQRGDGSPARTVIPGASLAKYFGEGLLIYQVGNDLMAASFDPDTLAVTNPRRLTDRVSSTRGAAAWAVAGDTLIYRDYIAGSRKLTWVDRKGASTPLSAPVRDYQAPSISPNGEQIASTIRDGARSDLWLFDLRQQTLTPITTDGVSGGGTWSGNAMDYIARRTVGAAMEIFTVPVNGSGAARLLLHSEGMLFAGALTPDQRTLVVMKPGERTGPDLWTFDMANPGTAALQPLVRTPANELGGRISPDGKWLAYFSDGSGRYELFVTAFAGGGPKWQVSRDGAREAVWSKDGKELFFRNGDDLHAVSVTAADTFTWAAPRKLLSGAYYQNGGPGNVNYDVSPDGQRFLMIEEAAAQAINVIRGWPLLLK